MKQQFASVAYRMLAVLPSGIFSGGCAIYVSHAWNNREIIFPTDLNFFIANKPIDLPQVCFSYSIINYSDSGVCKSCKLKLEELNELIQEFKLVFDDEFEVMISVHTSDYEEPDFILCRAEFTYPVAVDEHDSFNTLNCLSKEEHYHSFLLDIDNRVLAARNISADVSGKIISPGFELVVPLTFIADSITGSFDRKVDVFYKERESPDRNSVYGYIHNTIINQQNYLEWKKKHLCLR